MNDLSQLNEFFSSFVRPVLMGSPRALAMLMVFPMLPAKLFPTVVRNGIAIALILPMYPVLRAYLPDAPVGPFAWLVFILKEATIGAAIGWSFGLIIWVFEAVGAMLEIQTGTATGAVFDPLSNAQVATYTQWLRDIALALFLVLGGLLAMTGALYHSYVAWPVTEAFPRTPQQLWEGALAGSTQFLLLAMSLALPLIIGLLAIELGLGLMNRSLPQLNVFALSMPIKMLAAMLGLTMILGYYLDLMTRWLAEGRFNPLTR